MRTLLRSVIWLYPASWRRRYARELSALLDDIEPGGRALADLLLEALTMRIATFRLIPVACALTGVLIAVAITASGPDVYASAATLRLSEADSANPQSSVAPALADVLNRAKDAGATARDVTVTLQGPDHRVVEVRSVNTDPARAHRVTEQLSSALVSDVGAELLAGATVPQTPVSRRYVLPGSLAAGVGLGLGVVGAWFGRRRARTA